MRMQMTVVSVAIAGVAGMCGTAAQGAVLANGNFSQINSTADGMGSTFTADTFTGWQEWNSTTPASRKNMVTTNGINGGLVPGGNAAGDAAYLRSTPNGGALIQSANWAEFGAAQSVWQLDFDFAMTDAPTRGLNVLMLKDGSINGINLMIDGAGKVNIRNGGAWNILNTLGTAQFSTDGPALDGLLNKNVDAGDVVAVNHLKVAANWAAGTPSYSVTLNGVTQGGLTAYHGTAPATGAALARVMFASEFSDIGYVVDNVTLVPEPTTMAMFGLVVTAMVGRRRRAI